MISKLVMAATMVATCLCYGNLALAQFGGLQVQIGGYGNGVGIGNYGYGNGLYNGLGYSNSYSSNYGNYYSSGYGGYGNSYAVPYANYYSSGDDGYGNNYTIPYGNYYSSGYGSGYAFGRPSVLYGNGLGTSVFGSGSYPSMSYRLAAPRYYATPLRRFAAGYR